MPAAGSTPRVAFLTTDLAEYFVTDDELAFGPLRHRGIDVTLVPWREPAEWAAYDLVVVRSPWDYQRHTVAFLETLARIDTTTRLENAFELMRWNLRKTYLNDLAAAGIPVVPTLWSDGLGPGALVSFFRDLGTEELVVKPAVGAAGEDTFRVREDAAPAMQAELLETFRDRPLMAQPFVGGVLDRGESSVVWMGGAVSHGVRKTPPAGEFRSQEEHGGHVEGIPVEGSLADAAARVARFLEDLGRRLSAGAAPLPPLYGRVDFLPGPDGWLLGELELVEPSLYLRLDEGAPARLADSIVERLERSS